MLWYLLATAIAIGFLMSDTRPQYNAPLVFGGLVERQEVEASVEAALTRERQLMSVSQGRPGELPDRYTTSLTGGREGNPVPWPVVVGPRGRALRITGQGVVALRDRIAVRSGQTFRAFAQFVRTLDPTDPSGATVRIGIQWLNPDLENVGRAILYSQTLTVAMGVRRVDVTFGDATSDATIKAPASAAYGVLFAETFDINGQTDFEWLAEGEVGIQGPVGPPPQHEWDGPLLRFETPGGGWGAWTDLRGPAPQHQWQGTNLRFRQPGGAWGQFTDLKGDKGDPGNFIGLNYNAVVDTRANLPQTDGLGNPVPDGVLFFVVDEGASYIRFAGFPPDGWVFHERAESTEERPHPGIIYVREDGSNNNAGTTPGTAVKRIEEAVARAWAAEAPIAIRMLSSSPVGEPLELPDTGVSIIGDNHARRTALYPDNGVAPEMNVILCGDGTFVTGVAFSGWRLNSLAEEYGTGSPETGFAVSFRPGAIIQRAPYIFNCTVWTFPGAFAYPPPGDRTNGNPLIPRGAGAVLVDGATVSAYSNNANILTWGFTPAANNGLGVLCRNRGFANPINSISVGQHIAYVCEDGGRMKCSGTASQFGDFSFKAKGSCLRPEPARTAGPLAPYPLAADGIVANKQAIVDAMWNGLTSEGLNDGWAPFAEEFTKKDAGIFVDLIAQAVRYGYEEPMIYFAEGLFNFRGDPVWGAEYEAAFIRSFELMRDHIGTIIGGDAQAVVVGLVAALNTTVTEKPTTIFISEIVASAHDWNFCGTGMDYLKVPEPRVPEPPIRSTIIEADRGRVYASGQSRTQMMLVDGTVIDRDRGWSGASWRRSTKAVARGAALAYGGDG